MKSAAGGKKIFFLMSAMILLCIFLTGPAIAQRIGIALANPGLIQEDSGEAVEPEDLLPVELLLGAPIGYIKKDYRILTQEYGVEAPSVVSIRNLSVYPPLANSNGFMSDYSSFAFGVKDIFGYNRLNNGYTYNYGNNFNYSPAGSYLFGWYGLPTASTWLGNSYKNYTGYQQYVPNSFSYLLNQFISTKRGNTQESGSDKQEPDPDPAQLEETVVTVYADADGSAITLSEGETLGIILESNVTTGYRWDLNNDLLGSQVLAQINAQYISGPIDGDEPLLGAGGYEQWIFQAIGVGTATIELNYKHSWEEDIADTFTIEVYVQEANETGGQTGLANPASVYCVENGGISEIRTDESGSYGVCIFNDGTECDEWAYFRGECGQ